ncbi:amidohydrolase family protein [Burkholderia sp. R-69980]|nr:amidohydrolase family protein [Burkholderia sp. R-69980]
MTNHELLRYSGSMPRSTNALQQWHSLSPREAPLEPDLPIVDSHHHLFGSETDHHYYRASDLQQDIAGGHNIVATIYMEGLRSGWKPNGDAHLRPVGEVEMIARESRAPLRTSHGPCYIAAGIVAHADLTLGSRVSEVLEAHRSASNGKLRGIRHQAAYDEGPVGRFSSAMPKSPILGSASYEDGLKELGKHGLSFDAWVYHHQLGEFIRLVDRFPEQPIVLNHVGGLIMVGKSESERAESLSQWRAAIFELAKRPNVSLKIGGMGMAMFGFGFEDYLRPASSEQLANGWNPLIEICIEAFGTTRCMFESNFPVDKHSCGYTELWNAFKICTRSMSPDERSDLFFHNACRFYRISITGHSDAPASN